MTTPEWVSAEQVQQMIDAQLESLRSEHDAQMADVNAQLDAARRAAAGAPVISVPEHSAGPGIDVAETWSQWEQTLARDAAEAARAG